MNPSSGTRLRGRDARHGTAGGTGGVLHRCGSGRSGPSGASRASSAAGTRRTGEASGCPRAEVEIGVHERAARRPYTSRRAPSSHRGCPCSGARMRRLTRVAAFVAAGVIALSTSTSGGPILAAGPVLRYLAALPARWTRRSSPMRRDVELLLQLYAGLTRLDETGEPYPSLASGWEISADGLTYGSRSATDLEFSDGAPLVAEDIRRSWLRLLDPATAATAPDVLSVVLGRHRNAGRRRDGGRGRDRGAGRRDAGRHAPPSRLLLPRHRRHPGDLRGARAGRCDADLADRQHVRRQWPVRDGWDRGRRPRASRQRAIRRGPAADRGDPMGRRNVESEPVVRVRRTTRRPGAGRGLRRHLARV